MNTRVISRILPAAIVAAMPVAWVALAGSQAADAAGKTVTVTAVTAISDRPDSGYGTGTYLANDYFTRTATITLVGEVSLSFCGGKTSTGHCYHWTGQVTDTAGRFVTVPGIGSPGYGGLNGGKDPLIGVAATGTMSGGIKYDFYSSFRSVLASLVPKTENDLGNIANVTGRRPTHAWVLQFFGAPATFWVSGSATPTTSVDTTGGWSYTLPFGADAQCPHLGSQWVDASPGWGNNAADGNILAPTSAHC